MKVNAFGCMPQRQEATAVVAEPMTAETNLIMPQNMAMVRFLREQEIF